MRNTVHLGDCLEIMQQIPSGSVDMILCDLPYGTTACKWDTVIPFAPLWEQYERVIKDNGAIVLTAGQPFTSMLVTSNAKNFRYAMVWDKTEITGFLNSKRQPLRRHEDVLIFYSGQPTYNPQFATGAAYKKARKHGTKNYGAQAAHSTINDGRRCPTTIIDIPQIRIKNGHPTQKPVALFEYLIKTYTNEGDVVLDNCAGSGTTGIACINTGRDYILIEKEPDYYNIIQERIAEVKHKQASQLFAL